MQANHLFGKGVCLSHYNLVANIEQTLAPGIMPIVEYKGESENQGSLILLSTPGGEGKIQPEEEKGEKTILKEELVTGRRSKVIFLGNWVKNVANY